MLVVKLVPREQERGGRITNFICVRIFSSSRLIESVNAKVVVIDGNVITTDSSSLRSLWGRFIAAHDVEMRMEKIESEKKGEAEFGLVVRITTLASALRQPTSSA